MRIEDKIDEYVLGEMTDKEFKKLKQEIKKTMEKLEKLQKEYIKQTGQRYKP